MYAIESTSADMTRQIGAALAGSLPRPVVILLDGDYGAGKTTLVQGIASAIGVSGPVRSPSYSIVKLYTGSAGSLVHVDLYRAHSGAEIDELGILEFIRDDSIVTVEWPGDVRSSISDYRIVEISIAAAESAMRSGQDAELARSLRFQFSFNEISSCEEALNAVTAG